jgi:FMN-dependent NADH-azoreductase
MANQPVNVLLVNASARYQDSVTRQLARELITALHEEHDNLVVKERDVAAGMPFVDEQWVNANFTPADERTPGQQAALAYSDSLVDELELADILVIAAPVYNFSVPATLKAWIDQISRVGRTFNFTSAGSVGHLKGIKAYAIMASGGTRLGSDIDFASGYLCHILDFIGIEDVAFINADAFNQDDAQRLQAIRAQIRDVTRLVA